VDSHSIITGPGLASMPEADLGKVWDGWWADVGVDCGRFIDAGVKVAIVARLCMDLKIPFGIVMLLVAEAAAPSASALVVNCNVDGVYGPDGQPSTMSWRINLVGRSACLLPECGLKADVTVATPKAIVLIIQGDPNLEQRFEIDRATSTFLWTVRPPGRKYSGPCHEEPATRR
jgi:hypothetical protein